MTTALTVISADMGEFALLPVKEKRSVIEWLDLMGEIMSSDRPHQAILDHARRRKGLTGWSKTTIRRQYDAFRKSGDWRVLVNRARVPEERRAQPPAFVEFFKGLCERNQRASRPAYRALLYDYYYKGVEIPGIGTWRDVWTQRFPGVRIPEQMPFDPPLPWGWSERNISRYTPSRFERAAARTGRAAAAQHRPLVFSSRVGLECGQFYMFDDLEHDILVNFLGTNRRAMRPLELCCLDVFSACKIAYGLKPVMMDAAEEHKQKLKETDMRFLLAYILTRIGFNPHGCTLIVERGTAAIREPLERDLLAMSDGKITVSRSPIQGAAAFAGQFDGRSVGNPRMKAALESHHNLSHNELAALPGQIGKDRIALPEESHGRQRYNEDLIKAACTLAAERAQLLVFPFLQFDQFHAVVDELYARVNDRDWHKLEGWLEAGLVGHEYRLGPGAPWLPMQTLPALPAETRAAIETIARQPGNMRTRRLSPTEVWERGRPKLARLPDCCVPMILGEHLGVDRKVKGTLIELQNRFAAPGPLRFVAQVARPDGVKEWLREGHTYLFHLNPFDPAQLFVSHAEMQRGAYIGTCARWETVCRADTDALHRQMGQAKKIERELLAPVAARGAQLTRERIAMHRHNADVLRGAPVTAAEHQVADRIAAERVSAAEVAAAVATDAPRPDHTFSPEEIDELLRTQ